MLWMSSIQNIYAGGSKKPFQGRQGEDWEATRRLFSDQAQLAKYTVWTDLQDGNEVSKAEYVRLLTILVSFFPEATPSLSLVERNKTAFEKYVKDYATADADCQSLYATLTASLRRLSKADDTFWFWVKFFVDYRVSVKPGLDAASSLWKLDKMFDQLQATIDEHAENNGGHLKPSTLTPVPVERPWEEKLREIHDYYDEVDLRCGKGDDPTLVIRCAMQTNQKDLLEAKERVKEQPQGGRAQCVEARDPICT